MAAGKQYVALLRGINVVSRPVKMADLRALCESLGWQQVQTYITTGNVVFCSPKSAAGLRRELEAAITKQYPFSTQVFVLTLAELRRAAKANPFQPAQHPSMRCHLVFLEQKPAAANVRKLMALAGEEYRFAVKGKVFYYAYDKQYDGRRRRNLPFEKILGSAGTARTWKVVDKLIALSAATKD